MSKSYWLLSAAAFAFATPAYAQDNSTPTNDPSPLQEAGEVDASTDTEAADEGEIVITAQGRAQVLQDVPIAVTAVNAESMQNSGATDIRQLNQLAPSLLVSSTGTEANGSARIRGIGTVGDNPGLESSVAVFIDGVYRSRSGIGLNELGEIERVEVLRGPQGTLFGRNASAGLIHIISKKPNLNDMEGYAEASYGNYDFMRFAGGLTGPIGSGDLGYRLDGVVSQRDGFYDVVNAAGGTESSVNDRDRYFVRGQLLWEPNSDVEVRLIGDYTHRNESCCAAQYYSLLETTDPTPATPGDSTVSARNRFVQLLQDFGGLFPAASTSVPETSLDRFSRDIAVTPGRTYRAPTDDWGVSGQVDYDFGGASLTSITAYRQYKSEGPGDLDYGNVDLLYRPDDGNAFRQFKTFSQELRLQGSAFNNKLDWLIGGYFGNEKLHVRDNLTFGSQYGAFSACGMVARVSPVAALRNPAAPGCLSPVGRATLTGAFGAAAPVLLAGLDRLSTVNNVGDNVSNYYQKSRNFAVFTHNIFNITDQLSLTLGLRYTNENKDFRATFNNSNTICPTQQAFFSPFLPGGAAAFPASLQAFTQAIVNLTCQGNSSSALNTLTPTDERDEGEWTGTGILSMKASPDVLVYASYARGYKAGGFNLDRSALGQPIYSPTDPRNIGGRGAPFGVGNLQFDAEIVDAYELGMKFSKRGVTFNAALFRQTFKDFQLNTFNGSVFLVQNINGCSSALGTTDQDTTNPANAANATGPCPADDVGVGVESLGVELEGAVTPVRHLSITAGATYAKTKYKSDLVGRNTGIPLDQALFLLPGDNLSNAPEFVVTSSLTWTPPIGGSGLSALFYVDSRMSSEYNTGSDLFPEKEQDSFVVVNGRIGIRGPDERWGLELWGQNLFNVDYTQVAFNTPFQGSFSRAQVERGGSAVGLGTANQLFSSFLAEPRTFGITGRFRF
jgi:iron complex outermembrane receptor protein